MMNYVQYLILKVKNILMLMDCNKLIFCMCKLFKSKLPRIVLKEILDVIIGLLVITVQLTFGYRCET